MQEEEKGTGSFEDVAGSECDMERAGREEAKEGEGKGGLVGVAEGGGGGDVMEGDGGGWAGSDADEDDDDDDDNDDDDDDENKRVPGGGVADLHLPGHHHHVPPPCPMLRCLLPK